MTNNPVIHDLGWRGIRTVFSRSYFYNYAPIHLLSYMVDDALWGLRPSAFAFTNVVLHAANGALFYLLLIEFGWRRLAAWAAALIFLVHPVQVESVAWISQRKAVLSLLFFLLALLAFVRYRRTDGRRRWVLYAASLLAFGLALLTKATTVVFPLIAVLFDRHFERERSRSTWLLDKLPFLGAAAAVAVATVRAQSPEIGGGTSDYHGGSPFATLLTMLPVLVRYLGMVAWPARLSAVYAPSIKTAIDLEVLLAAALLALVVAFGVHLYRRRSEQLVWLLVFAIGLLPVSQIIPIVTLMNDWYLYLPMLGASAFIVGAVQLPTRVTPSPAGRGAGSRRPRWRASSSPGPPWRTLRVPVWRTTSPSGRTRSRTSPHSPKAHFQLAHVLEKQGQLQAAVAEYQAGLALLPVTSERYFLGLLYEKLGATDLAREQFQLAVAALPSLLGGAHGPRHGLHEGQPAGGGHPPVRGRPGLRSALAGRAQQRRHRLRADRASRARHAAPRGGGPARSQERRSPLQPGAPPPAAGPAGQGRRGAGAGRGAGPRRPHHPEGARGGQGRREEAVGTRPGPLRHRLRGSRGSAADARGADANRAGRPVQHVLDRAG